jgi:hemolysin III
MTSEQPDLETRLAGDTDDPLHLPLGELKGTPHEDDFRPSLRGWIHTGVLPFVIAAGVILLVFANGAAAQTAAAIFFGSSVLLFGNSALYHRFRWRPSIKVLLKRIDHANIFLLIAGTYTPIAASALVAEQGSMLLIAVWTIAVVGIAFRVFWINAPRWLYVPIYLAMGWVAVFYIVELFQANWVVMTLVVIGGALYSVGAVIYGLKRPNPIPNHFGFHEIFHTLTVLAFACHWVAALLISLSPVAGSLAG